MSSYDFEIGFISKFIRCFCSESDISHSESARIPSLILEIKLFTEEAASPDFECVLFKNKP